MRLCVNVRPQIELGLKPICNARYNTKNETEKQLNKQLQMLLIGVRFGEKSSKILEDSQSLSAQKGKIKPQDLQERTKLFCFINECDMMRVRR